MVTDATVSTAVVDACSADTVFVVGSAGSATAADLAGSTTSDAAFGSIVLLASNAVARGGSDFAALAPRPLAAEA
jgi:hypothetical protein